MPTYPPTYDPSERYPDYDPHPVEQQTAGVDNGLMSDRFYDQLMRTDPSKVIADSKYANRTYNAKAGTATAAQARATTRAVHENELSQKQLDNMLASGSPLMKRAAAAGLAGAASRGLMNSSLAQGNAMGAMIDRAQPFALQDAAAYGKTASENMQAKNTVSLENARMRTSVSQSNAANKTQANIANMEASAARDRTALSLEAQGWDTIRNAMINIENREDTQAWQTAERVATNEWQSGENELNRIWTTEENALNRTRDWAIAEMQAYVQRGATREQAAMQILASIYSNPELTAAQQSAAARSAMNIVKGELGDDFYEFAATLPPWVREDVASGENPAVGEQEEIDRSNPQPPSNEPPLDADGNPDYSQPPPNVVGNPAMEQFWWSMTPRGQQYYWEHNVPSSTHVSPDPEATTANEAAGQYYTSPWNPQAEAVSNYMPPV